MSTLSKLPLRIAAVAATASLVALSWAPGASAAEGDVEVTNTETVKVYTDASGNVTSKRVYEQLAFTGSGTVDVSNPIETDGLRNLDGFGGFDVEGDEQVVNMEVDGEERLRSVSNYEGDLPLEVEVTYSLDGEVVDPSDVVGESGNLEVLYTVRNITATPQEITFDDGAGGTVTKTVDVPIPLVGSVTTTLPSSFTEVDSKQANMAGDGKGGTKLSFTLTLFPPIGSDTAEFGYSARISDGIIPRAEITALAVNPLGVPTFAGAADSYQNGADTGLKLADGAATIDENLLKLRDGAGELLAGLIKLRDGSNELYLGLAGTAVPGARKLADGMGQLDDGVGRLNAGVGELDAGMTRLADGSRQLADGAGALDGGLRRLAAGADELSAGTGKAFGGSRQLADGADRLRDGLVEAESKAPALLLGLGTLRDGLIAVDAGLAKMYDSVGGIPAKAQPLFDGIQALINGIGTKTQPDTLVYGVNAVRLGLTGALPKIQTMADGVYKQSATEPGAYQKLGCAITVLGAIKEGTLGGGDLVAGETNACFISETNPTGIIPPLVALTAVNPADDLTPDEYRTVTLNSVISGLVDGRNKLATADGAVNETTLYGGLLTLKAALENFPSAGSPTPGAIIALAQIQCGLDNTSLQGETLPGGVPATAVCKTYPVGHAQAGQLQPGLKQGLGQVSAGVSTLVGEIVKSIQAGIGTAQDTPATQPATLRGGMQGLIGGVGLLSEGGKSLIAGLGLLTDGSGELSGGADELTDGLSLLDDGAGQLAAGAGDAAAGAGKLSDGAGQLADGAAAAKVGTTKLADGTKQLADGSRQLADGSVQLADGLGDAADGSRQITDGLSQAADGAPKLVDGAQRLSDEGTSKLVEAGEDTAQSYGEMVATIQAGAERADASKMAYGAPEGAQALMAYSYAIEGEDGEGGRNVARGLAGLALLGAGAGAFAFRRGMV